MLKLHEYRIVKYTNIDYLSNILYNRIMDMYQYKDLAPEIYRQRLVIEGYPAQSITDDEIKDYLSKLSSTIDMIELITPITHRSDKYGWAGWIHWETSGAHFYAWEQPRLFFSVDIYTCKTFDPVKATEFTKQYFNAGDIVIKEF